MAAPGAATAPAAALSLSDVEAQAEALASELGALGAHVRAVRAADEHVAQWATGFGIMGAALGVLRQAQPPRAPNLKRKAGEAVEAPAPACDPRMPPPKSAKKAAPAAASAAAERWDRVSRPVYKDLPSKYQLVKEESARLEAVWRCVAIKKGGAVLSDVVKVAGCSVLQANECISVLVRVKLLRRVVERTGARYFVDE